MKLRSIVLVGILGASLLTMSGCNEDEVDKILDEISEVNNVDFSAASDHEIKFTDDTSLLLCEEGNVDQYKFAGNNSSYSLSSNDSVITLNGSPDKDVTSDVSGEFKKDKKVYIDGTTYTVKVIYIRPDAKCN